MSEVLLYGAQAISFRKYSLARTTLSLIDKGGVTRNKTNRNGLRVYLLASSHTLAPYSSLGRE